MGGARRGEGGWPRPAAGFSWWRPAEGAPLLLRAEPFGAAGLVGVFTCADGGGGGEPFDLGRRRGDAAAAARARLLDVLALPPGRLFAATQVHGSGVVRVEAGSRPGDVAAREADALVTAEPGAAVGVLTADCVPVLMADPGAGAVAAAHAGWRGLVGGVLEATLAGLVNGLGAVRRRLLVAIGPAIGPCCYEVGDDVATHFAHLPGVVDAAPGARPHVHLARAAALVLAACGVPAAGIADAALCTRCNPIFASYRRDGAAAGRQMALTARP